jgi:hypothetical protein
MLEFVTTKRLLRFARNDSLWGLLRPHFVRARNDTEEDNERLLRRFAPRNDTKNIPRMT